ncbi:Hypothetical protein CINCED_3A023404 [Cinara cedri]|uniref:Uncharacterized protein n=1 Tax=Cinara cedri TaxID=506608 RepID=A0A5E4NAI1_9HEMI|nr:Hypothetical protein CINCED_3A023404 [Cinara cedri]
MLLGFVRFVGPAAATGRNGRQRTRQRRTAAAATTTTTTTTADVHTGLRVSRLNRRGGFFSRRSARVRQARADGGGREGTRPPGQWIVGWAWPRRGRPARHHSAVAAAVNLPGRRRRPLFISGRVTTRAAAAAAAAGRRIRNSAGRPQYSRAAGVYRRFVVNVVGGVRSVLHDCRRAHYYNAITKYDE